MGKEQELRPCPFCGGDASIHEFADVPDCGGCHALGPVADTVDEAIAAWNRRSSDEQAEVVGFDTAKRAEKTILREYELGNLTTLGVANHLRRAGFNLKYATDKANSLASPPSVVGLTEAKPRSFWLNYDHQAGRWVVDERPPSVIRTGSEVIHVVEVTAALAVGDEGIRERGMNPRVINRRTESTVPGDVYIGRGSPWGNPFRIGIDGNRDEVCDRFEREVLPTLNLEPLRGKNLVCYCAPLRCHGDSILAALKDATYE